MSRALRTLVWLTAVTALVLGPAAAPAARAQVSAQEVFVDQLTGATTGASAIASYLPNLTNGAKSAEAADDFQVTGASNEYWNILTITVLGENVSAPTVDQFLIRVYADTGAGLPGSLYLGPLSSLSLSNAPDYVIATNFILPAAGNRRFWLSLQANVTNTDQRTWNWQSSNLAGGFESAWIDNAPNGNAIEFGNCTGVWGARVTLCGVGTQSGLAFKLEGQRVTFNSYVYMPVVRRK